MAELRASRYRAGFPATGLCMNAFLRFLNNLDARAIRAIAVSIALFAGVALVFVLGKTTAVFDEDDAPLIIWLQENADSPWGLPATILVFVLAAFIGAPQFVLIAAAVVAFGPSRGFAYAWIATLVSASVNFWLGRSFGADMLKRYGGETANRLSQFVGRNGFFAAMLVRIVPSAPFIVVNVAAGVSHMRFLSFLAGTGVGVIPKTAFVAFAGSGLVELITGGDWRVAAALIAVAALWLGVMLYARHMLRRRESSQ